MEPNPLRTVWCRPRTVPLRAVMFRQADQSQPPGVTPVLNGDHGVLIGGQHLARVKDGWIIIYTNTWQPVEVLTPEAFFTRFAIIEHHDVTPVDAPLALPAPTTV